MLRLWEIWCVVFRHPLKNDKLEPELTLLGPGSRDGMRNVRGLPCPDVHLPQKLERGSTWWAERKPSLKESLWLRPWPPPVLLGYWELRASRCIWWVALQELKILENQDSSLETTGLVLPFSGPELFGDSLCLSDTHLYWEDKGWKHSAPPSFCFYLYCDYNKGQEVEEKIWGLESIEL